MLEIPYCTDGPEPALRPIVICGIAGSVPNGFVTGVGVDAITFWAGLQPQTRSHIRYQNASSPSPNTFLSSPPPQPMPPTPLLTQHHLLTYGHTPPYASTPHINYHYASQPSTTNMHAYQHSLPPLPLIAVTTYPNSPTLCSPTTRNDKPLPCSPTSTISPIPLPLPKTHTCPVTYCCCPNVFCCPNVDGVPPKLLFVPASTSHHQTHVTQPCSHPHKPSITTTPTPKAPFSDSNNSKIYIT